jgi:hypothetical protein
MKSHQSRGISKSNMFWPVPVVRDTLLCGIFRGKREVIALAYGGGVGPLAGQVATGGSMTVGGRRGMSYIGWHPDNVGPCHFVFSLVPYICFTGHTIGPRFAGRLLFYCHSLGPSQRSRT